MSGKVLDYNVVAGAGRSSRPAGRGDAIVERETGRTAHFATRSGARLALATLVALGFLAAAPSTKAAHYVEEGDTCYACHTLYGVDAEPDTNFINGATRTLPTMKAANGGVVPARFGCTYCHNNPANATMKEALSHFGAKTSKHPVGYDFVNNTESNN